MEGERQTSGYRITQTPKLLTINNAIEHFLYVESFREEQKICLNLVRRV